MDITIQFNLIRIRFSDGITKLLDAQIVFLEMLKQFMFFILVIFLLIN